MSPSVQPSSAHRQSGVHPAFTLAWCDEVVAGPSHPKAGVAGTAPGAPYPTRPAESGMGRVAVGIQAWSYRQRGLAETLAGLRLSHVPSDGVGRSVHPNTKITASASVRPNTPTLERDVSLDGVPVAPEGPSATFEGDELPTLPPFSLLSSSRAPTQPTWVRVNEPSSVEATSHQRPSASGPFDDLLGDLCRALKAPDRPLPPPDRFRVRVAQVPKPHRPTKRDYNYFVELDALLAERAARSRSEQNE